MRVTKAFALFVMMALAAGVALAGSGDSVVSGNAPAVTDRQAVDRIIERERDTVKIMRQYHPLVETYMQTVRPDEDLGSTPVSDHYYLGRLDLSKGVHERFYSDLEKVGWRTQLLHSVDPTYLVRKFFAADYLPVGFSAMIFPDERGLNRDSYYFQFLRREFLGNVRCLVFQVVPKQNSGQGRFLGRIWVEDQDYHIVRFNGTFTPAPRFRQYFHMDSWRGNIQPGVWLPVSVYSQESDAQAGLPNHVVRFKAQTRLWGYDLKRAGRQEEFTQMVVEPTTNAVEDESGPALDWLPVMSLREWQREAEDSVLDRLEQAGLLAPAGEVDKVLETVVNNLEVTNNLDIQPEIRCRVLLTVPLESFTVGHTIVVSRGLLDVLPDEASLAMVLSHELAHIARGDQLDTKYAFGDRMWFADESAYHAFQFEHTPAQEQQADQLALKMLKNSPYKDKLSGAGLFLRQLAQRAGHIPALTTAHLGDGLTADGRVVRMPELMNAAPELHMRKLDQLAALPLGSRIKLDPWNDHIRMMKAKPVRLQSANEKMPFEIAPVIPYLTRLDPDPKLASANGTGN